MVLVVGEACWAGGALTAPGRDLTCRTRLAGDAVGRLTRRAGSTPIALQEFASRTRAVSRARLGCLACRAVEAARAVHRELVGGACTAGGSLGGRSGRARLTLAVVERLAIKASAGRCAGERVAAEWAALARLPIGRICVDRADGTPRAVRDPAGRACLALAVQQRLACWTSAALGRASR